MHSVHHAVVIGPSVLEDPCLCSKDLPCAPGQSIAVLKSRLAERISRIISPAFVFEDGNINKSLSGGLKVEAKG